MSDKETLRHLTRTLFRLFPDDPMPLSMNAEQFRELNLLPQASDDEIASVFEKLRDEGVLDPDGTPQRRKKARIMIRIPDETEGFSMCDDPWGRCR